MYSMPAKQKSVILVSKAAVAFLATLFVVVVGPGLLNIDDSQALADNWHKEHRWRHRQPRFCSKTAEAAFKACQNEKKDDFWIAVGNCYNSAQEDQAECFQDAIADYEDAKAECQDQLDARKDLCDELGEAPYDPPIEEIHWVSINAANANPYLPLVQGYKWVYKTSDEDGITETNTDEVLTETKEIMGVECIVVHDIVYDGDLDEESDDHEVIEDTYDYYAQDEDGNVWYFGEFSLSFEEALPSMEGSWLYGVDGAKPGIVMPANPLPPGVRVGTLYRQEFALGDAEDWAKLESLDAEVIVSDHPEFSCAKATDTDPGDNCWGTAEGTPLEPDVIESKYYKPGIGTVLETTPDNERTELVEINF